MDNYSYAAEQMKEDIIREFLHKNPEVKRYEVVTRNVNGRIVVDTIDNVFKYAAGRRTLEKIKDQKLLKRLTEKGEKRLTASLESINSSKRYVHWLYTSRFTGFTEKDKNENLDYLAQREVACGNATTDAYQAKQKIVKIMADKMKSNSSAVRTMIQDCMLAVLEQLKCQASVFKKEVELGDQFSFFTKQFLESSLSVVKSTVKPSTLNAMAKAYQILKNESIDASEISNSGSIQKFKQGLDEFEDQLEKRREDLHAIQQLVQFLEDLIVSMGESSKIKKEEPEKVASTRMAFTSKKRK